LAGDNDYIDHRVSKVEARVDEHDRRLDKADDNMQRVQERLDEQRDGQVRTQTLVEVVRTQLGEVDTKTSKVLDAVNRNEYNTAKNASRNWEKAFWFVMTSVMSIAATIMISHFVHF
jgi:chromosome segregation ATPase